MAVQVSNLSFGFTPSSFVLNNINMKVEKGEALAIVGASGCGKSTLLRLISGILPKQNHTKIQGAISIDNLSPTEYIKTGKLSFMFQEATLMPNLTVKENIALPLKIKGIKDDSKVNELIATVGLNDYSGYLPKQLSGGMKTRVALARSFVTQPELLLLDEPFSALDIAWKSKLYYELDELKKKFNTSVIIVTHDIQESLLLSDTVCVLNKNGCISNNEKVSFEKNKITSIAEFTNSKSFHMAYASIQKWIIDDGVRALTNKNEVEIVLNSLLLKSKSDKLDFDEFKNDMISIRKYSNDKDVNTILIEAFNSSTRIEFKYNLIWDILNYDGITDNTKNIVKDFYINNSGFCKTEGLKYYNIYNDKVFEFITQSRLTNNYASESKRWIYLLDMFYMENNRDTVMDFLCEVRNGNIKEMDFEYAKNLANDLLIKTETITI